MIFLPEGNKEVKGLFEKLLKGKFSPEQLKELRNIAKQEDYESFYGIKPTINIDEGLKNKLIEENLNLVINALNLESLNNARVGDYDHACNLVKNLLDINENYGYLEEISKWQSFKVGEIKRMGLIQLDIDGHSNLVNFCRENSINLGNIMNMKANFAILIEIGLFDLGIKKLCWLGDGGIFANVCDHEDHYNNLIRAADRIYIYLDIINKIYEEKNFSKIPIDGIKIRVSAHVASTIWVHPNPEYWHSHEINFFAKNERNLSTSDAFVISREVHDGLTDTPKKRFPEDQSFEHIGNNQLKLYLDKNRIVNNRNVFKKREGWKKIYIIPKTRKKNVNP